MKRLSCFFLLVVSSLFTIGGLSAQCNYSMKLNNVYADSSYTLLGFSVKGLKLKQANKVARQIDLYRGDRFQPTKHYFLDKLKTLCVWKKSWLAEIEVYASKDHNGNALVRFVYREVEKSDGKK